MDWIMVYMTNWDCVKYGQISTLKFEAVSAPVNGKDVIGVLPTEFGYILPHVLPSKRAFRNVVLIVCPLNSIRICKNFEQITLVNSSSQNQDIRARDISPISVKGNALRTRLGICC